MRAFVTIGSTRFDTLIQSVFSQPLLSSLHQRGYTQLVVQCGNSDFESASQLSDGKSISLSMHNVEIEYWKFKPSLQVEYERADLIISHAGSGTILDVLRLGKPLIVIPNPTLLDNHQEELAVALSDLGHLKASTVADLAHDIENWDPFTVVPFPPFDGSKFQRLLDEEMGFI
ncbi:glycosyltransferase family 1 protein [Infundibulicybe gibba]|nr:glycosyltransferase family 1 protein [Infundibulicybe gibba]